MTIAGIDLGSRWLAITMGVEELPLRLTSPSRTLAVDPNDLDVVVAVTVEVLVGAGVTRAAIEFGKFYSREGDTPAKVMAMAEAHGICRLLHRELTKALAPLGIEVLTVDQQSWAHRLVPHHRGGIKTAESNEGVRARCGEGVYESFADQHQRDPAGVLLGAWLVDAAPRLKRVRRRKGAPPKPEPTPEEIEAKRKARREYKTKWQMEARGGSRREAKATAIAAAIARGSALRPDVFK